MKTKQTDHISNITTKRHYLFFKIETILKTCRNLNLRDLRLSLGDYIHVTFIS